VVLQRWKNTRRTRVVVVGGGFAGMYAALGLDKMFGHHKDLELVLIDRKNYFIFPPLLPSASVGTIETRQVTQSYRRIFETTNIRYQKATVTHVDPSTRTVRMHVHLEGEDMGANPKAATSSKPTITWSWPRGPRTRPSTPGRPGKRSVCERVKRRHQNS